MGGGDLPALRLELHVDQRFPQLGRQKQQVVAAVGEESAQVWIVVPGDGPSAELPGLDQHVRPTD
jgi:hypothetical protein